MKGKLFEILSKWDYKIKEKLNEYNLFRFIIKSPSFSIENKSNSNSTHIYEIIAKGNSKTLNEYSNILLIIFSIKEFENNFIFENITYISDRFLNKNSCKKDFIFGKFKLLSKRKYVFFIINLELKVRLYI